jgi:hypothetical protein
MDRSLRRGTSDLCSSIFNRKSPLLVELECSPVLPYEALLTSGPLIPQASKSITGLHGQAEVGQSVSVLSAPHCTRMA